MIAPRRRRFLHHPVPVGGETVLFISDLWSKPCVGTVIALRDSNAVNGVLVMIDDGLPLVAFLSELYIAWHEAEVWS